MRRSVLLAILALSACAQQGPYGAAPVPMVRERGLDTTGIAYIADLWVAGMARTCRRIDAMEYGHWVAAITTAPTYASLSVPQRQLFNESASALIERSRMDQCVRVNLLLADMRTRYSGGGPTNFN